MAISPNTDRKEIDIELVKRYGSIEFLARQVVEGFITGLHRSPYHGFSVEFAEHRQYNNGESIRHIDWKVFAKTDRLFVKRFEEETNLRCMVLADISSSMHYPMPGKQKLSFSLTAAASLCYLLYRQRDAVGLCGFSDKVTYLSAVKSSYQHVHSLFGEMNKWLDAAPTTRTTSIAPVLHEIAEKMNRRSLIILFSDLFEDEQGKEDLFGALQHLRHNKHEVIVFQVTDRQTEEQFSFSDRPYEFIDLESGERVKLNPSDLREKYIGAVAAYNRELEYMCGRYGIDFVTADTSLPVSQVLMPYLVKRKKMVG